ncbi:MAG TPA: AmmeMemoRadiSam system protein B [Bacteroidota bacterium]|nr:AmmeMemoRadiSam system protein B [Bacteroidota bacterium]
MKTPRHILVIFPLLLCLAGRVLPQKNQIDRQPAVAGQFYPAAKGELQDLLKKLFADAVPNRNLPDVVAIICPHAGYIFSGEVAASSFSQIDPNKQYDNIFILGPSHTMGFEGASVYTEGNYITPLGTANVNRDLGEKLVQESPFFTRNPSPHANEHSVEVQVPFLQYYLKKSFTIVPIVIGAREPGTCKAIGAVLKPYLNPHNLFVISSDFSHYPGYDDAVRVDNLSADAVVANSVSHLIDVTQETEAKKIPNLLTTMCGWSCIVTLLSMTDGTPDFQYTRIQYKNSGDMPAGDKGRVVGYNAIAVSLKGKVGSASPGLTKQSEKKLLSIARDAIKKYVSGKVIPIIDTLGLTEAAKTNGGAFVTLRKKGDLRGCVGRFEASEPLYKVVQEMAIAAATEDYRFEPVQADEVGGLEIEISALTPLRRISSIDEIELGKDGVYIKKGSRSGTFLPQVEEETGWSKEEFLGHCAQDKAGLGWDGWKDAEIYVYRATVFSEKELGM